jgi:hypothetical protein
VALTPVELRTPSTRDEHRPVAEPPATPARGTVANSGWR